MRKSVETVVPGVQSLLPRTLPGVRGGLLALVIASASMYPAMASALGLGEITLHSALNQPLDADIELVETGGLNDEDVIAKLAPPEVFAQSGVERVFFLNDLRFTPIIHGGRGVIHVVSNKPVTEPFLNFLVQISRPNGDLLHEYTVLLDPATTEAGKAATRGRNRASVVQSNESRMPVAPPPALQSKHYVVVPGDNLASIARRVHGKDSKVSAEDLATGIKALNPQAFPGGATKDLKVGQNLLLPDSAALPTATPAAATAATPAVPAAAAAPAEAEQLASAAIANQQLSHSVDDLKEQLSGRDKEIVTLETQLAELKTAPAKPAATVATPAVVTPVAATPAAPVVAPAPAPVAPAPDDSFLSPPILLGALLILLLLLGLLYSRRRNRDKQAQPVNDHEPLLDDLGPTPVMLDVPAVSAPRKVAPAVVAPIRPQAPAAPRPTSPPDALDGVNIYIAYGRFTEALGILREALTKQPERMDIRARILELLAEQGDVSGFAAEEQSFIAQGLDPQKVEEIRGRYPQLKKSEAPAAAPAAAVAPVVVAAVVGAAAAAAAVTAASAAKAKPTASEDDFQLNLDDLSMDADWDLVDPFDTPRSPKQDKPVAEDPAFSSNLTQLPEVFEMPEEQFLSDFAEPDDELSDPEVVPEPVAQVDSDALDDDFLDGFMDVSSDFDLLDLEETPLSKINQAQMLIDDGDVDSARLILEEVIAEGDEAHQRSARDLLEGLD